MHRPCMHTDSRQNLSIQSHMHACTDVDEVFRVNKVKQGALLYGREFVALHLQLRGSRPNWNNLHDVMQQFGAICMGLDVCTGI